MQPRGKVLGVRGAVVDVSFQGAELPQLDEALVVDWDQPGPLLVEVQAHLDEQTVRGVAHQATAGLQRGVPVFATGQPIIVPVGDAFPLAETLKGERVANHPAAVSANISPQVTTTGSVTEIGPTANRVFAARGDSITAAVPIA